MQKQHTQLPSILSLDSMLNREPVFDYNNTSSPCPSPANYQQLNVPVKQDVMQYQCVNPEYIYYQPVMVERPKPKKNFQKKGLWTHEEDLLLIEAVKSVNPIIWDVVAEKIPGRNAVQCRERWRYRLDPSVDRSPFQKWEDDFIISERKRIGNMWTLIATKLPGRTVCSVKNRWYSVLRHRMGDDTSSSA